MKKTIAILAACVLAASVFAGCGGNNNSSSAAESTTAAAEEATTVAAAETENDGFSGEWVTSAFVDAEGTEYSVADYAALNGVEASTLEITYAFDGNGKATCTGLGTTVEGTYTVDGTTVKTAFEGSSPEFTYSAENETLSVTDAATGVTTVMAKNA